MARLPSSAAKTALALALMMPLGALPGVAHGKDITLTSKFRVSYLGFNVGVVKGQAKISDDQYVISGGAKSNSLVSIIRKAKASFASSGKISGSRLVPNDISVSYKAGKKSGRLAMGYSNGGVASIEAKPKIKYKPGTVPLKKAHMQEVIDPVSSLLFPVKPEDIGNGRKVCNRVLPVFDGRSRMNLVFSYKSSQNARAKGFKGKVHTCSVRYQPVSGIRPKKSSIKFMKANRDMYVTMARVADTNVYSLFAFKVRTKKGYASGKAYEFSTN